MPADPAHTIARSWRTLRDLSQFPTVLGKSALTTLWLGFPTLVI